MIMWAIVGKMTIGPLAMYQFFRSRCLKDMRSSRPAPPLKIYFFCSNHNSRSRFSPKSESGRSNYKLWRVFARKNAISSGSRDSAQCTACSGLEFESDSLSSHWKPCFWYYFWRFLRLKNSNRLVFLHAIGLFLLFLCFLFFSFFSISHIDFFLCIIGILSFRSCWFLRWRCDFNFLFGLWLANLSVS